jgi:hypothetical protein
MKFNVREFHEKLSSHYNFHLDWTVLTITLQEDPHAYLHVS